MGFMKDAVRGVRDKALAAALNKFSEEFLLKYGLLKRIEIDSSEKSMEAEILLHGESEPVTLKVGHFEIISADGNCGITVHRVSASREWIDTLARDYLEGRTIAIPSPVAHALTFLL